MRWRSLWFPIFLTYYLLQCVRSGYSEGFHSIANPTSLTYSLLQCVRSGYPEGIYSIAIPIDLPTIAALQTTGKEHLVLLFAFLMFLCLNLDPSRWLKRASMIMSIAIICSPILLPGRRMPWQEVPVMSNPSMAATFVVLASGLHPLSAMIALACRSYTALLCFAIGWIWTRKYKSRLYFIIALVMAAFFYFHGVPDNGRLAVWKYYLEFWKSQSWGHVFFGIGPGATRVWLPWLDYLDSIRRHDVAANIFLWAHNDWLQELIEIGITGTALILFCARDLWLLASDKNKAILLAFGAAMMTDFPIHWYFPAIVLWSICSETNIVKSPG
jgi:hypothetical protein